MFVPYTPTPFDLLKALSLSNGLRMPPLPGGELPFTQPKSPLARGVPDRAGC